MKFKKIVFVALIGVANVATVMAQQEEITLLKMDGSSITVSDYRKQGNKPSVTGLGTGVYCYKKGLFSSTSHILVEKDASDSITVSHVHSRKIGKRKDKEQAVIRGPVTLSKDGMTILDFNKRTNPPFDQVLQAYNNKQNTVDAHGKKDNEEGDTSEGNSSSVDENDQQGDVEPNGDDGGVDNGPSDATSEADDRKDDRSDATPDRATPAEKAVETTLLDHFLTPTNLCGYGVLGTAIASFVIKLMEGKKIARGNEKLVHPFDAADFAVTRAFKQFLNPAKSKVAIATYILAAAYLGGKLIPVVNESPFNKNLFSK